MRFLRWTLIVVALVAGSATRAEETERTVKTEDFPKVYEMLAADADAQQAYRYCPAEVWNTARPFWRRLWDGVVGDSTMGEGDCDGGPLTCLSRCLDWKSGNACFQSARTLQEHAERDRHASVQALFAQACALGYPAGCTNRAAGIKNGGYEGDPIPDPLASETASCITRAFEIACGKDDAWGCTMYGMAQRFGEAIPVDAAKARAAFQKSCAKAPNFAAFRTARSQLEEMDETKEGASPRKDASEPDAGQPDATEGEGKTD